MRIAIVNSHYYPNEVGGAEHSVRFLARTFVQQGAEVHVLTTGDRDETFELEGVKVWRKKLENSYWPLEQGIERSGFSKAVWHARDIYNASMGRKARQVLAEIKPQVVHTNNLAGWSVAAWNAAHDLQLPIVHTLRDYYLLCPATSMFRGTQNCERQCGKCKLYSMPKAPVSNKVAVVVGNSDFILQKHLAAGLFTKARSRVIFNAYRPDRASVSRPKADKLVLGYIGRISPTKGVEQFLRALAASAHAKAVRVLIAGSGDAAYIAYLKNLSPALEIEFLGHVKPADFYDQVDFSVVPSMWHEPLARVLFESYAHGVPVIASDTGGTPEAVENGQTGFMFSHLSQQELISALESAYQMWQSDQLAPMVARCLSRAQHFLPERLVDEYRETYQSVIAK